MTRPRPARALSGKAPKKPAPTASTSRRAALRRKKAIRPWWYGFLVSVGLMTVLAACAVGVFLAIVYSLAPPDPLEYYTPEEVSRVYDRSGTRLIGEFRNRDGEQRLLVQLEDIPKMLRNAFLAIEDSRFYNHFGVDIIGITRAIFRRLNGGRLEGGSTITQQLTRGVGLAGYERTYQRKIKEALLAVWIELHYSKDQILEFYLNQVPEGGQVYGVKMAAEKYFSKDLNELTIAECATLAGIPKDPSNLNPLLYPEAAKKRRNIVLARMYSLGEIDERQYEQARNEPLAVRTGKRQVAGTGSLYPYFVNGLETDLRKYYREELERLDADLTAKKKSLLKKSKGRAQAGNERNDPVEHALQTGGLRITATIDPKIQEICQKTLRNGLVTLEKVWQGKKGARQTRENKKWDGKLKPGHPKDGVKLMEITKIADDGVRVRLSRYRGTIPKPDIIPFYNPELCLKEGQLLDVRVTEVNEATGEIKGEFADSRPMQGSIVVLDARNAEVLAMAGGAGFLSEESGWHNQAMSNSRLLGSCFKPFIYAAAFEYGHSPNEIIVDEPIVYPDRIKPYPPKNYERDGERPIYFGPNTLIEALMHSRNVSTIRLFEALRISKALEIVRKFDFAYPGQPQWRIEPYYPSGLGTMNSSPFVLASAYQVFANLGVGVRPKFFTSIVDSQGHIPFPTKKPDSEREVIKPLAAFQAQYLMRQVIVQAGATGRAVGAAFPSPPNPPICAKTGTTDDCRDAWFAGYTPDLVIVSQIGFDPPRPMSPGMTGGTTVAPQIWIPALKEILKTRRNWRMTFDAPEGMEVANICGRTGKRASSFCSESDHLIFNNVPFAQGKAPKAVCDGQILVPLIAPVAGGRYDGYASLSPVRGVARAVYGVADDDEPSPE